jgi:hypothetical protein
MSSYTLYSLLSRAILYRKLKISTILDYLTNLTLSLANINQQANNHFKPH